MVCALNGEVLKSIVAFSNKIFRNSKVLHCVHFSLKL